MLLFGICIGFSIGGLAGAFLTAALSGGPQPEKVCCKNCESRPALYCPDCVNEVAAALMPRVGGKFAPRPRSQG